MAIDRSSFTEDFFEKSSEAVEVLDASQNNPRNFRGFDEFKQFEAEEAISEPLVRSYMFVDEMRNGIIVEEILQDRSKFHNAIDTFQSVADINEEVLESLTIEWFNTAITLTEVTDPTNQLTAVLNTSIADDIVRVDYEVLPTSTAVNIEEYLITGNGEGTMDFNGGIDIVKTIEVNALTQALAKPARTINVRLKNPVGTGNHWPKIIFNGIATTGGIYLFDRTVQVSEFGVGSTAADSAQRFANFWNTNYQNSNFHMGYNKDANGNNTTAIYGRATAVVSGNVVEMRFSNLAELTDNWSTVFYNYNNMNNVIMRGNTSGSNFLYVSPQNGGRTGEAWTLTVGLKSNAVVTIAGHGARPGIVSMLSYDADTRRMTKRAQVPQTAVFGLKTQLDSILQRLKNKGF